MKIKNRKKNKFILILVAIAILFVLFLITRTKIMKKNIVAKSEYEISLNGMSISLDNVISKTPNVPVVGAGMIPIKWNDNANMWEITTSKDSNWYDYSAGKFANVMLSDGYYKSELEVGIDDKLQLMENNIGTQIADTGKLRNNLYLGTEVNV